MKHLIEFKHVGPKAHVRQAIDELIRRLEEKFQHLPPDATSIHVLFEENGTHTLYRTSLTCHVPGLVVAAHEEGREAGATIREAFRELERQLAKREAMRRRETRRRRSIKTRTLEREPSQPS